MANTPLKKNDELRHCNKHGLTGFVHEPSKSGSGFRCRRCRNDAVTRKRRALKQRLVDHLGGKCATCGYSACLAALHFHHLHDKDALMSRLLAAYKSKQAWEEVEKCLVLCANCHAELHADESASDRN